MLAHLIDRADFLRDVGLIRKKFNITTLLEYEEVINYLHGLGNEAKKRNWNTETLIGPRRKDGTDLIVITDKVFTEAVQFLEKKYKKNSSYGMAFAYSIVAGVITEKEFSETTHVQYLDDKRLKNFTLDGQFQVSIVVLRETRKDEVLRVFRTDVQRLFKSLEFSKPDTFPNIRRDREWYWLKKEKGWSWSELEKYVNKSDKKLGKGTARSALINYEKKLKEKLYSTPGN